MKSGTFTQRDYLFLAICTLLTAFVYWPGMSGPFVYDDLNQISDNINLHHIANLKNVIFCGLRQIRVWQNLSFALNWSMAEGRTWVFKSFNLGLHLIDGFLLFRLLKIKLHRPLSVTYFATALFLLHPLQIQAVTYVMGRVSLIETFFKLVLLNILDKNRVFPVLLVLLFSYLGKESNLILPLLIVIYWLTVEAMDFKDLPKRPLFFYFLTIPVIAPLYYILRDPVSAYEGVTGFSLYPAVPYFLAQLNGFFFHIYLIFNPSAESLIHPYVAPDGLMMGLGILAMLFVVGLLYYAVVNRTKRREVSFFILFYFFCLAPTNSILQMINPFAEYRLYAANISVFVLLGILLEWVLRTEKLKSAGAVTAACLLFYWAAFTYNLNFLWQDSSALLKYSLNEYPRSAELAGMLGREALVQKDYQNAEKYLKSAINANQSEPIKTLKYDAFLVRTYLAQGRYNEADQGLLEIKRKLGTRAPPPEYETLREATTEALSKGH